VKQLILRLNFNAPGVSFEHALPGSLWRIGGWWISEWCS
jgi:hypothetical protein